jgi:glycosyltransferase involved in cell wall biosynthesis
VHLSIVLPCYRGARYLDANLRRLHAWLADHRERVGEHEVLLVDDGSPDGTAEVAEATGLPVRVLRLPVNRGKGAAVRAGMRAATGEFRIFMDADMPFDFAILERMLHYLEFKEFDVVVGSRVARGTSYAAPGPGVRRLASRVFSSFVGRLVVTGVPDTQCGIKGFRGEVADYLFSQARVDNFAFDIELLYLAFKNGFDVKGLPVQLAVEQASTVRVVQHGLVMLWEVLRLPLRYYSGAYTMMPGRGA